MKPGYSELLIENKNWNGKKDKTRLLQEKQSFKKLEKDIKKLKKPQ